MTVKWSPITSSFEMTCVWGCHAYDFESEIEAETAELTHDCKRGVL